MSRVLLFGGTREGHFLAGALVEKGQEVTLSVATEYGEMVLEPELRNHPLLTVHSGRLDEQQMDLQQARPSPSALPETGSGTERGPGV